MSNVTLDIAGRTFTVACAEGEEAHIGMLGRTINAKLLDMPNIANQTEARALLFAALLLADENHELKRGGSAPAAGGPDIAGPLEALAERLESLAARLENEAA
jgi:cell division protein ZapA